MSEQGTRQESAPDLIAALDNLPGTLRTMRQLRGLSQRAAAKEIGVGYNTVSRLEEGHNVNVVVVRAVLVWLRSLTDGGAA